MPKIRFIKDGVFLEEDKRYDTDDVEDVSDEMAALMYKRNWAVPVMDDVIVIEPAAESDENKSDQEDEIIGTMRVPRRK